jgi:hypothetical protein
MPILGIIASQDYVRTPPTAYESIATVTVGATSVADVTFSSIPSTYTHLQIRCLARASTGGIQEVYLQLNSDTGNNYAKHNLLGDGTSASASGNANQNHIYVCIISGSASGSNIFGTGVIDILDYANTNKYKTTRSLNGNDENGDGYIGFYSGLWQNTNAITSIKFYNRDGNNLVQYSQFALYGIKGA